MHYVIIVIMAIEVKFISSKNFTSKIILNLKTFKFHNYDFKTIGLFTTSSAPISLALKSYLKIFITLYSGQSVSGFWQKCFLSHEQLQFAGSYGIKKMVGHLV